MRFPEGIYQWLTVIHAVGGASFWVGLFIINELFFRALEPEEGKPDRYPPKAYFGIVACIAVAGLANLAPGIAVFFETTR